ncbi:MAG TPA: creatininase family protein [Verrucomicrobia bacterium]|nr:creatininase family protein [Verrucomicrobiota bacterium]HOB31867.1 creatininase family protein [Verrucomicrobiota bacterium]HOP96624.1 creatininase family protein [Verrucomicrobiota bacterium]HPU56264.1 creatininase family protein [Verrucomicrobiota bacterium]
MKLSEMTWSEAERLSRDTVVLFPVAAIEQHSRHLPFATDAILCEAVATRVESANPSQVLLLPLQWLGASSHHLGMAGTLSADLDTYPRLLCDPLRCLLRHGFRRVFILNGHGGNVDGFHLALRQLALEFPEALLSGASYWDTAAPEIANILSGTRKNVGHACEFETSLMMYLRPDLVRMAEISDDDLNYAGENLSGVFIPLDMKRQTRHGGSGQATLASAEKGKALLDAVVSKTSERIRTLAAMQWP